MTNPGEIVIDACMGSGTTILAAERTRHRPWHRHRASLHRRGDPPLGGDDGKSAVLAETGEALPEVAERRLSEVSGHAESGDNLETEAA